MTQTKTFVIIKKTEEDGRTILETTETKTVINQTDFDRDDLISLISRLTLELADYQKLLTDMDATPVSLSP